MIRRQSQAGPTMRADLTALRQRVERLAAMVAELGDVSRWTDAELRAEVLALLARLDRCRACDYDIAAYALACAQPADSVNLDACPRCGALNGGISAC